MHTRGYEGTKKVVNVVVGNSRDVRGILPLCAEVPRARAAGVPDAWAPAVMGQLTEFAGQLLSSYTVCILWVYWSAGSRSRRAGKRTKKEKKEEISWFEVLDFLLWKLEASPVAWTSFTKTTGYVIRYGNFWQKNKEILFQLILFYLYLLCYYCYQNWIYYPFFSFDQRAWIVLMRFCFQKG